MTKRFLLLILFLFSPFMARAASCDGAGNCYVRQGATGSGNGSNWTNACTGFNGACAASSSSMRGTTIWVAAGAYGAVTFSAAASGTTLITVEAATIANHGPASDWNNSFAGQATFLGGATFSSSYWTINGQTRGADWKSGYNFKFQSSGSQGAGVTLNGTPSNVTLEYVELQGYSPVGPSIDDSGVQGSGDNFYIGYSYVHDVGDTNFQQNNAVSSNMTYEYNWVSNDGMCGSCNHFEAYSILALGLIIRYNFFENIVSSGIITDASGGGNTIGNWDVYGNVFFWDPGLSTSATPQLVDLDDGVITLFGNNYTGFFHFYNNTIEGISPNIPQNRNCNLDAISAVSGPNTWNSVTIAILNNLWVNNGANVFGGCQWLDNFNDGHTNPTAIHRDNAYAGGANGAMNQDPGDTVSVQTSSSGTLLSAGSPLRIADFQLQGDTTPGATLSSPYNVDMLSVTRGADGTWDRGAFQYSTGASTLPNPPTNVRVSSVQ